MDSDDIIVLLFLAEIAALVWIWMRVSQVRRIFITDYQRGIRFLRGAFTRVLQPGAYNVLNRTVEISIADMRPRQFVMECLSYRDAMQNDCFISIGGELSISDPYLAFTKLKDQFTDSLPTVRETLRAVASRGIGDASLDARDQMAQAVMVAANAELSRSGMRIVNLEITEMWSRPQRGQISAGLN
jgi:hypothetical protein